ncbi:MAG: DUF3108 domain-containing protein [Ignavibacteria bacterium]|nr:DUF3108 domain-containing protein [Ignavibacteria bacterium]
MKKLSVLLLIVFCSFFSLYSQKSKMIFPGEDLLYEVSFFGIKLGTIRIVTEGIEKIDGNYVFKTKAYINSYPSIPFLDLQGVFNSWMDSTASYSFKFTSSIKQKGLWFYEQVIFDHNKKLIQVDKFKKNEKYYSGVIHTEKKWNDGLSLFFFAREYTKSNRRVKTPTFMDKDTSYTLINFHGKRESVKISSIAYPVKTVNFYGKAEWTGIYGLTGFFEGWFSDDDASIPIKAKLNVYVGSINVELIKWSRKGWVPPKG